VLCGESNELPYAILPELKSALAKIKTTGVSGGLDLSIY